MCIPVILNISNIPKVSYLRYGLKELLESLVLVINLRR